MASSPADLAAGSGTVWDSGKVTSSDSVDIRYAGPALSSGTRYWWAVQAWDAQGAATAWSAPAWFETGLLRPTDWTGRWIGTQEDDQAPPTLEGASWIWFPEGNPASSAPAATRYFRHGVTIPDGTAVVDSRLVMTADDGFTAWVDGREVAHTSADPASESWRRPVVTDVTDVLTPGRHVLAVAATNGKVSPAGLIARLEIRLSDGREMVAVTDGSWKAAVTAPTDWQDPSLDDNGWADAKVLAAWGQGPWGRVTPAAPTAPEPLLRKDIALDAKPVERARLYVSGVGYADVTVNGSPVTDAVLEPGFTRYDKRVEYVTRDVTALLRAGDNAIGVRLGRGFYGITQPNVWKWHEAPWHGEPRLLAQLVVEYADGTTTTVGTDPTWEVSDGPVRFDSLYGGETYDAREEQPGWDAPGFDDTGWRSASELPGPTGQLVAEQQEPIRITQTLRPTSVTNPKPGVFVFAMPRNIAGWARIRVQGPAGTIVRLKYGEKLNPDGTVQASNGLVTGRFQTDEYVLAGRDTAEQWESRYTYKGFQYVEVTGWPGTPTAADLDGRVVHSDITPVGDFTSSQPMFDTIRTLTTDTLLNNLHGIPTDTPMYEKNGWTGDAQLMAETSMFELDMRRLYEKWLYDIEDSQGADGVVPGVAPDNGWGLGYYGQAPPWNAAFVMIPWWMYERYGDRDVLVEHYAAIRRYVEHEIGRSSNGLHASSLNDYLAPGYGGNSPEDPTLAGTAYAYLNISTAARIAEVLGKDSDVERYRTEAARVREAFNAAFLRGDAYVTARDPGYRQTSNLLPLAFGMVPQGQERAVLERLVQDIHSHGDHLNTGALGTKVLLPELTRRGYGDLAYRIATQHTYPSWGYWLDNGATSLWERWDLGSRSRDHVFLGGAIDEWFFEDLAGIQVTRPGYARFVVAPQPVGDLRTVSASTRTVHGRISVSWVKTDNGLKLKLDVPVGTIAELRLPAPGGATVEESGSPVASADGVERLDGGELRYEVQSGSYRFTVAD